MKKFSLAKKPDSKDHVLYYFIYRKFKIRQKSPKVFGAKSCVSLCGKEAVIIEEAWGDVRELDNTSF